jgi:hypothetical protein
MAQEKRPRKPTILNLRDNFVIYKEGTDVGPRKERELLDDFAGQNVERRV